MRRRSLILIRQIGIFLLSALLLLTFVHIGRMHLKNRYLPLRYSRTIDFYCKEYGVSPALALAVLKTESNFFPYARSSASARGLMQLTERTWQEACQELSLSAKDIYHEENNIQAGVWYLSKLQKQFSEEQQVLAAYNAGPGNVTKWTRQSEKEKSFIDKIPFVETRAYIAKIAYYQKNYQKNLQKKNR